MKGIRPEHKEIIILEGVSLEAPEVLSVVVVPVIRERYKSKLFHIFLASFLPVIWAKIADEDVRRKIPPPLTLAFVAAVRTSCPAMIYIYIYIYINIFL